jgi:hypothetical protein
MIAQTATASTQQSLAAQQSGRNLEVINRLGEEPEASTPVTREITDSVERGAQRLQEHIAQFRIATGNREQPRGKSERGQRPDSWTPATSPLR